MNTKLQQHDLHYQLELFDIIYSETSISEKLARTYLHCIIEQLDDFNLAVIEPTDLLLNLSTFQLIVSNKNKNKTMVDSYLAPELLIDDGFLTVQNTKKCVVFSLGTILFILLIGNIPFQIANKTDKYYAHIIKNEKKKFWQCFSSDKYITSSAQKLIWRMLQWNAAKRCSINEIKKSKWYLGEIYDTQSDDLMEHLKNYYIVHEFQRLRSMQNNVIFDDKRSKKQFCINIPAEMFPMDHVERILDAYCSATSLHQIYYCLSRCVEQTLNGKSYFHKDQQRLICMLRTQRDKLKFFIKVYESRRWKLAWSRLYEKDDKMRYKPLFLVRFKRLEGDAFEFMKIRNEYLLKCAVINGLSKQHSEAFRAVHDWKPMMIKRFSVFISDENDEIIQKRETTIEKLDTHN